MTYSNPCIQLMDHRRRSAGRLRLWPAGLLLVVAAAGCETLPGKIQPASVQSVTDAKSATAGQTGEQVGSVGAVEEFLKRTDAYALNPAQSPSAELPPPPVSKPLTPVHSVPPSPKAAPSSVVAAETALAEISNGVVTNAGVELGARIQPARPMPAAPVVKSLAIAPSAPPPARESAEAARVVSLTNQPVEAKPAERTGTVDDLFKALEDRVQTGEDFDAEWQLRLMQLAVNRDDQARAVSSSIPEETRSVWMALFDVIAAVRMATRNAGMVRPEALQRVDALRGSLAARANPEVASIHLCRRVVTFGVFEEMSMEDLVSGRAVQTIVYSELRNIRFERETDGQFRAKLGTRLEVLTADGQSVWSREEPLVNDLSRSQRTDFFLAQRLSLPVTLRAGDYVLKLYVEDKLSGRAAEGTLPFQLKGTSSVASGG